jgi:hypothetical protein
VKLTQRIDDLKTLDGVAKDLKAVRATMPKLPEKLEAERKGYLDRHDVLKKTESAVSKRAEVLVQLQTIGAAEAELRRVIPELKRLSKGQGAGELGELLFAVAELLARVRGEADALLAKDVARLLERFRKAIDERDKPYLDLKKQQQEFDEAIKREDRLKEKLEHYDRFRKELDELKAQERTLLERRRELRGDVCRIKEEISKIRKKEVDAINERFGEVVHLELGANGHWPEYRKLVEKLLAGSNLRNQAAMAQEIVEYVPPDVLVDAVEQGDVQALDDLMKRDEAGRIRERVCERTNLAKVVALLVDHESLYNLETVTIEDELEIFMRIDAETTKPLQHLSKGQMATALLPLVLREADYPLIFDQPEDDLDNRFIFQTLVTAIQKLKLKRQLIFVTHNANIPVLGEADRVILMQMESPTRAAPSVCGTVDELRDAIIGLLEGGEEAFDQRGKRYEQAKKARTEAKLPVAEVEETLSKRVKAKRAN